MKYLTLSLFAVLLFAACSKPEEEAPEIITPEVPVIVEEEVITWEETFGGIQDDKGYDITQTADGGYIAVGSTNSAGSGNSDIYVVKTDEEGQEVWSRTLDVSGDDVARHVVNTPDQGFVVFGEINNSLVLIKFDQWGAQAWLKTISIGGLSQFARGLLTTTNNRLLLLIESSAPSIVVTNPNGNTVHPGYEHSTLIQIDQSGNEVWREVVHDQARAMALTAVSNGGYMITSKSRGDHNLALTKVSNTGQVIWQREHEADLTQESTASIIENTDGDFIILSDIQRLTNENDWYLLKVDSQGNWKGLSEKYPFWFNDNIAGDVQQTQDGGYILTGAIQKSNSRYELVITKLDEDGEELWTNYHPESLNSFGTAIQTTPDGGFVIVGFAGTSTTSDLYLIKTDEHGEVN